MHTIERERETRCLRTAELRIDGKDSPRITGYAARFNTWADIGGIFREQIRPGAFAKTIQEADIRALVNHDENYVLGRNKVKTLALREDDKGLAVEIDPPATTWANDLLVSMRRGDVSQMSFGFEVVRQDADYSAGTRILEEVKLYDVSVVTFPAYNTTSAEVRAAFEVKADRAKWKGLDTLVEKIKAGQRLTQEERKALMAYAPAPAPAGWRGLLARQLN